MKLFKKGPMQPGLNWNGQRHKELMRERREKELGARRMEEKEEEVKEAVRITEPKDRGGKLKV